MALVLSTIVIFGYNWWMQKFVPSRAGGKGKEAARQEEAAPRPASRRAAPPAASPATASVPAAPVAESPAPLPGREITIETDSVIARVSTAGGRVVSWRLRDYTATGATVLEEMVPLRAARSQEGPLSVRVSGDPESTWSRCETNTSFLSVHGEGEGILVATQRLRGGRRLVRKLIVPAKGHMCRLELELDGPASRTLEVIWKPGTGLSKDEEAALSLPGTYQNVSTAVLLTTRDIVKQGPAKKPAGKAGESPFWAALRNKYFVAALVPSPLGECEGVEGVEGLAASDGTPSVLETGLRYRLKEGASRVRIPLRVYIGPQQYGVFKKAGARMERILDFGMFGIFAVWLLYALKFFASFTANYGIAIILLTIAVRGLLWWPSQVGFRQMKKMQTLKPQMDFINDKFKSDPQRKQEETMRLFRENKVNPLGGCLPFALQLPVFFALFAVLGNAIELRGAPFFLWISDLSVKDPLYVTPALVGVTMWVTQALTPTVGDPQQAKMMRWMTLIFVVMFANAPSGLNLYWLVQNLIQIGQQWITNRAAGGGASRRT